MPMKIPTHKIDIVLKCIIQKYSKVNILLPKELQRSITYKPRHFWYTESCIQYATQGCCVVEAKLPLQYTKFEMLSRDTFFHRLKQVVEEGLGSQHVEKIYIFYSFPDGSLNETKVKRKSGAFVGWLPGMSKNLVVITAVTVINYIKGYNTSKQMTNSEWKEVPSPAHTMTSPQPNCNLWNFRSVILFGLLLPAGTGWTGRPCEGSNMQMRVPSKCFFRLVL